MARSAHRRAGRSAVSSQLSGFGLQQEQMSCFFVTASRHGSYPGTSLHFYAWDLQGHSAFGTADTPGCSNMMLSEVHLVMRGHKGGILLA